MNHDVIDVINEQTAAPSLDERRSLSAEERQQMILDHLTQVRLIARRIHERLPASVSLEDLVSTGILGLISAVDRFDPSQNFKLKTYAEYKIRGAIQDSLRDLDWAPRTVRQRAKDIEAAITSAEQRLKRAPTEEEIADELGLSIDKYRERLMETHGVNIGSLEWIFGEDNGGNLLKYLCDDEEAWPSRLLERSELERLLAEGIEQMPHVERMVLSLYYYEELTIREISRIMGRHESTMSLLKSQAILRLRSYIQKRWPCERGI